MVSRPVLYILMRNDMDSLNPYKANAQSAHAANQFTTMMDLEDPNNEDYIAWLNQAKGFGVTIVLEGSLEDINAEVEYAKEMRMPAAMVWDTTYPLRDGKVTHHIDIPTCGFVFTDKDKYRVNLPLYGSGRV